MHKQINFIYNMKNERIILLNEIINNETYDYNVLAAFKYENAVDLMTKYFIKIAGYEMKLSEAIVNKLLGTLYEDVSEIVTLDNDWCIQCTISQLYS